VRKIFFSSTNLALFLLPGGRSVSAELGLAGVGVAVVLALAGVGVAVKLALAGVGVAVKLALADRLYNDDGALASPPHGAQQLQERTGYIILVTNVVADQDTLLKF
jgi:hypothetical protein